MWIPHYANTITTLKTKQFAGENHNELTLFRDNLMYSSLAFNKSLIYIRKAFLLHSQFIKLLYATREIHLILFTLIHTVLQHLYFKTCLYTCYVHCMYLLLSSVRWRINSIKMWMLSSPLSPTLITVVIILGDFNVTVGCDSTNWEAWLESMGLAAATVTVYYSSRPAQSMTLWSRTSPFASLPATGHHGCTCTPNINWHPIDYVIIRKRDRQRVTKAMCSAECQTDHRLIFSKLKLHVQPKRCPQGTEPPKRLNVSKLKVSNIKQSFVDTLQTRLESTMLNDHDVEVAWATLRKSVWDP